MRESPSLTLAKLLKYNKAEVSFHDNFIPVLPSLEGFSELAGMKSVSLKKNVINSFDAILVITNHSYIDFDLIAQHAQLIIDTRNALKNIKSNATIIKA